MKSNSESRQQKALRWVVSVLTPLLVLASALGLFYPAIYEGLVPAHYIAESRGQDLVTLFIAVPLLIWSLRRTKKGGARALLLSGGAMGYTAYVSIIYAYGGVANTLYFVYVACLGLSVAGLALSLAKVDRDQLTHEIIESLPRRSTAIFLFVISGLLSLIWGGLGASAILEGAASEANTILVTDLAFVIPAFILGGVWLWQSRPEGVALAGMLLVLNVVLNASIVAGQLMRLLVDIEPTWGLAGLFSAIALGSVSLAVPYLRKID